MSDDRLRSISPGFDPGSFDPGFELPDPRLAMPFRHDCGLAVCPLGSGSKGNAWWLEGGGTAILVDAGFATRTLAGRVSDIGRSLNDVEHLFITHEHTDHVKSLPILLKKHKFTLWASGGTLKAIRHMLRPGQKIQRLENSAVTAGGMTVKPIRILHDAAEPLGYRFEMDGASAAVITDLGCWDETIAKIVGGPDILVCESNHDPVMLRLGPYPWHLKKRIASNVGHLANSQAAALAGRAVALGTRRIVLAHLSEVNNAPDVALDAFRMALNGSGAAVELHVADQHHPGPWIRSGTAAERAVAMKVGAAMTATGISAIAGGGTSRTPF